MKLGITVVYLFGEENESLLDTHLGRIARHTTVPYTIYASVNRLAPTYRERLERRPEVKIIPIPDTELRGGYEHAYYLEHLIEAAIDEGATHVATMHLDSFPIRNGWAQAIASRLSERRPLATLQPLNTACLFFTRGFYLRYRPPMRLPGTVRRTELYQRYQHEHQPPPHSGIGYGFAAYREGLECLYLQGTDELQPPSVFDDLIFHMGGAVFNVRQDRGVEEGGAWTRVYVRRLLPGFFALARRLLPSALRKTAKARLPRLVNRLVRRPQRSHQLEQVRRYLEPPAAHGTEAGPGGEPDRGNAQGGHRSDR